MLVLGSLTKLGMVGVSVGGNILFHLSVLGLPVSCFLFLGVPSVFSPSWEV